MKKLKAWQVILLIIFYPVGIAYLIYRICKKKKSGSAAPSPEPAKSANRESMVFVTEKGKVFHSVPDCSDAFCDQISEKDARKRWLRPCKKCCSPQFYKFD